MRILNAIGDLLSALSSKDEFSTMDVLDDILDMVEWGVEFEPYEEDAIEELLMSYIDIKNEMEND